MNIFINPDEDRFRAGWRIAGHLFFIFLISAVLAIMLGSVFSLPEYMLSTIAVAIAAVIATVLAAIGLDNRSWQEYGLAPEKRQVKECGLGFLLAGAAMAFIFIIEYAVGWLTLDGYGWQQLNNAPYILAIGGYLLIMIMVGFYEELVCRGYQIVNISEGLNLPDIHRKQAVIIAILITSIVFGVGHIFNPNAGWISTINIVLAGVMLAFPFVITGRLAWSIGLHIGWNFFQGGVFGFPVSGLPGKASVLQINQGGPAWLTGGAFGPEAGLLGLVAMLLIVLALIGYLRQTGQPIAIHPSLGVYQKATQNRLDKQDEHSL